MPDTGLNKSINIERKNLCKKQEREESYGLYIVSSKSKVWERDDKRKKEQKERQKRSESGERREK